MSQHIDRSRERPYVLRRQEWIATQRKTTPRDAYTSGVSTHMQVSLSVVSPPSPVQCRVDRYAGVFAMLPLKETPSEETFAMTPLTGTCLCIENCHCCIDKGGGDGHVLVVVCVCVYVSVCICIYMCTYMYMYLFMYKYVYIHIHVYIYMYVSIYILYTYIYSYIDR